MWTKILVLITTTFGLLWVSTAAADKWTGPMRVRSYFVSQDIGIVRVVTDTNNEARDIAQAAGLGCNYVREDLDGIVDIELGSEGIESVQLQQMLTMLHIALVTYRFVSFRISEDHCSFVAQPEGAPVARGIQLLRD